MRIGRTERVGRKQRLQFVVDSVKAGQTIPPNRWLELDDLTEEELAYMAGVFAAKARLMHDQRLAEEAKKEVVR